MQTRLTTNKLRERRIAQGFRQVELAAIAGVSVATLNKTENWHFKVLSSTAARLARALDCKPSDIFPDATK